MTGKEAKEILGDIKNIRDNLLMEHERSAFYMLGRLVERLEQIIAIDRCSFNSTIDEDEEKHESVQK